MKSYIKIIVLLATVGLLSASSVAAALDSGRASLILGQLTESVSLGDLFNLPVRVRPNGELLDTVRVSVHFPAEKLEAINFSLGSLFPNLSPGSFTDNDSGWLYQGGFRINGPTNESGVVGYITFRAKSSGRVQVNLGDDSLLLGAGKIRSLANISRTLKFTIRQQLFEPVRAEEIGALVGGQDVFKVSSTTHPDANRWYANNRVVISWEVLQPALATRFLFAFDGQPNTNPAGQLPKDSAKTRQMIFDKTADGVWYFHLKSVGPAGKDSQVSRYLVRVDTTPPNVFLPYLDKDELLAGESTRLNFGTVDQHAGVSFYKVMVGDQDLGVQKSPFDLSVSRVGEHAIRVSAYDQAGNMSEGSVKLTVVGRAGSGIWGRPELLLVLGAVGLLLVFYLVKRYFKIN